MARQVRNIGRPGVAATAISAVDIALWDLKARLLSQPLAGLLGLARQDVPVYGSGGFTSYDDTRTLDPAGGMMSPDLSRPGHGLTLRDADAERYRHR
jgi:L-alanine-DL-glutamate epimerase-like enolase superfamily enzyme